MSSSCDSIVISLTMLTCKSVCNQIDVLIGLKSLHVNTLIDPIELDQNDILIGLKGVVYSFSFRLKPETERTQ